MYYRLNPDLPDWAATVIAATTTGVRDVAPYADDHTVLADMPNRPGASCCA